MANSPGVVWRVVCAYLIPTAAQTAFYCVKYRCNRNDDCSGRGDPSATAGGSTVAYWPDCGVCVCDEGYSGARCETFVDATTDILTQHRARWPVTYGEAAAACEAAGEALAPLRSEAQWGKLMLGTGPMLSADQSCWLGARAAAGGGVWRWHPSPHSRLSGAVLSNERVLAFRMFAPWSATDYSTNTAAERLMKIKTTAALTSVGTPPNTVGNKAIFYTTTAQPAERLACYYCARFLCNNEEDCHGNAASVSGVWPDCKCVCRGGLPLIGYQLKEWMAGDCRTRTISMMSTVTASIAKSPSASASASVLTSVSKTIAESVTPSSSALVTTSVTKTVTESLEPSASTTLSTSLSTVASVTATIVDSASLSGSLTRPQTPTVSLPPLIEPLPPRVGATSTLANIGFGARYTHYSPIRPLVDLYSGLSLLFTEDRRLWYARRFLGTAANAFWGRRPTTACAALPSVLCHLTHPIAAMATHNSQNRTSRASGCRTSSP